MVAILVLDVMMMMEITVAVMAVADSVRYLLQCERLSYKDPQRGS